MNHDHSATKSESVRLPSSTIAPLVLAVGVALISFGIATNLLFAAVGLLLFAIGLVQWIGQLLPGRGHVDEPLVPPAERPRIVTPVSGEVEKLKAGAPGYRLRLPVKVHPVSAGIKGGLVGGVVMLVPALLYGVSSGHGIWWPVNLLAGMVLPGVGQMSTAELEQFHPELMVAGIIIHIVVSLVMGLMYGVLMPTLPEIAKPISWGALLMPLAWTAVSYVAIGQMNPILRDAIEWPWFMVSQLVFGLIAAVVFMMCEQRNALAAGILGGAVGGLLMPIPAILWSLAAGHTIWYPGNLLSALVLRHPETLTYVELEQFRPSWLTAAILTHVVLSLAFGLAFAIVLPPMPNIRAPLAWGGLLLPLLWTGASYGLMGVVNPVLQQQVDWPWFIVSQFVFGIVAAIVVIRSEQIYMPPAGLGARPFPS